MKKQKKRWFSMSLSDVKFCFVCGGKLRGELIPGDKRKRLVCVSCRHISYTNPKSVTGLIPIMPDGRVALLRRNLEPGFGKWSYPAGFQEIGESSPSAAERETMEEICARAKVRKLLGVYSYPESNVVTIVYVGKILRGERPKPGVESIEVKYFRPHEIPWSDLAFRSTEEALKDWIKSQ